MFKQVILIFVTLVLFVGCFDKASVEKEKVLKIMEKSVSLSKRALIDENNVSVGLSVVTYISQLDLQSHEREKNEVFIISIYMNDENKEVELKNVKINGILVSQDDIKRIEKTDSVLEFVAVKNEWMKHYMFQVPRQNVAKVMVSYQLYPYSSVELSFPKEI